MTKNYWLVKAHFQIGARVKVVKGNTRHTSGVVDLTGMTGIVTDIFQWQNDWYVGVDLDTKPISGCDDDEAGFLPYQVEII